jgi:hypothetical protein
MALKDKKWFKAAAKVAPWLLDALPGPWGGVAGAILSRVTGTDEAGIEKAIAEGDPEIFAKLQEGERLFKLEMEKLGVKREELEYKDIADARARQLATKDWVPAVLTAVALTFFFWLAYSILNALEIVQENESFIMYLLGVASAWVTQGYNFFLGSSKGSQRKTDLLANGKR